MKICCSYWMYPLKKNYVRWIKLSLWENIIVQILGQDHSWKDEKVSERRSVVILNMCRDDVKRSERQYKRKELTTCHLRNTTTDCSNMGFVKRVHVSVYCQRVVIKKLSIDLPMYPLSQDICTWHKGSDNHKFSYLFYFSRFK